MELPQDYNPIQDFQKLFFEIDATYPEEETNAVALSTIGIDCFPKTRIVLLKKITWEGFIFYTNYNSEKGKAIANNNQVSLLFNWSSANQEVLISGRAEKIAENLSEGYFESRPEGSKLSAWASEQSEVIPSRKILEDNLLHYETKFKGTDIPKPDFWGGYLVRPEKIIFTKHDPLVGFSRVTSYSLQGNYEWVKEVRYIAQ